MTFTKLLAGSLLLASLTKGQRVFDGAKIGNTDVFAQSDYEYVVVGSGAGGATVAARLAAYGHSVLLMEAGDNRTDSFYYQVPVMHAIGSEWDEIRWDYFVRHHENDTEERRDTKLVYDCPDGTQKTGLAAGPECKIKGALYPRVGSYGGCTYHNAEIMIKAAESDWDFLVEVTGDNNWNHDNMDTYFERVEDCRYLPNSIVGHGFGGWLQTSLTQLTLLTQDLKVLSVAVSAATAMGQTFLSGLISTVTQLGHILIQDFNEPGPARDVAEGLYQVPLSVKVPQYTRSGPIDFVEAVRRSGAKLDVALNMHVTKINFDHTGPKPRAVGVDFLGGRRLYGADPLVQTGRVKPHGVKGSVKARREVIISGGFINTPQLLKLSGIGAKEELAKFNIPTVVDLPGVGTNMQDRYEAAMAAYNPDGPLALLKGCTFGQTPDDPCLDKYYDNPPITKGAYTTNGVAIAIRIRSSVNGDGNPTDIFCAGWPALFTGYFPGYFQNATAGGNHWTWYVLKAYARNNAGVVNLLSDDPLQTPDVRFHSFEVGGDEDLQAVIEGLKFGRRAFHDTVPLDGPFIEMWPGPEADTDEELKDFAKREAWGHHGCCTCKMGAAEDRMAVVDGQLRVHGVDGLRIVDNSVFPKIMGYFPSIVIYQMAEKAADDISRDAKGSN